MQRTLDSLALLGIAGVLAVAFWYQFVVGELPCPLCALQRVGFVVAGTALVLNLRAGPSPAHYGLAILSAVAAGSASLRQISLHVIPNTGHYGSALFGMHFYTWAFVGYGALVVFCAVMLMLYPQPPEQARRGVFATAQSSALTMLACVLFLLLAAANTASFLAECGLGPCPDNPVGYLWWPK